MNCEKRERLMLLAQSGELPVGAACKLEAHIADCPHCRGYRESLGDIFALSTDALPTGTPSDGTLQRIRVAAMNEPESGRRLIFFPGPVTAVLAAAAALAVAVGVWTMTAPEHAARPAADLDAIIMMVQSDNTVPADYQAPDNRGKTVRELADDLLSLEGFAVDDYTDDSWSTSEEAPPATGLRSRSTPGSRQKICV